MLGRWPYATVVAVAIFFWLTPTVAVADQQPGLRLVRTAMCESITDYQPVNEAVAFSITVGRISCFTAFEAVPAKTYVLHRWYRRDELVTTKRLTLKPPSWATYSSIQLREADKGPWRVVILNKQQQILNVVRFSVTD